MILEVIDNIKETYDTNTIRFKIDGKAEFKPGQFAFITLDVVRDGKNKTERKPYSIASVPGKDYIDITVKKQNPGPFSTRLMQLKKGEKVKVEYPFGLFTYNKELGDNIVMVGAGSGIVPLMSILRWNIEQNKDAKIKLIYSNKTEEDIIYYNELKELEKKHKNFDLHLTLTQQDDWHALKGRINDDLIREIIRDHKKALFYVCGPPKMVSMVQEILLNIGVEKVKVKTERYD